MNKQRDCLVRLSKEMEPVHAVFHLWSQEVWVIPPSPMIGGHHGGQMSGIYALVELDDGTCAMVPPSEIKFINEEETIDDTKRICS